MRQDWREKILALERILSAESTTLDKVESVAALLKGYHPQVDEKLSQVSKHLTTLRNLQEGNVVEISAERLPEGTEKEKRRKRLVLLFLKSLRELKAEVERVGGEIDAREKGEQTGTESFGKIVALAKGPFGIISIVAIIVVGVLVFVKGSASRNQTPPVQSSVNITSTPSPVATPTPTPLASPKQSPVQKEKVQAISYGGRKIPLSELEVRTGPDCTNSPTEAPHYHAKNGQFVRATDGTVIPDPGACAFGKVDETQVEGIEVPFSSGTNYNSDQDLRSF